MGNTAGLSGDDSHASDPVVRKGKSTRGRLGRRIVMGVLASIVVVALVVVGYGWWTYQSVDRVDLDLAEVVATEPRNFLVIGSDSRSAIDGSDPMAGVMLGSGEPAGRRSDSIALLRVDPDSDRIDVLSIPRDLWVLGPDGEHHRINEAFSNSTQDLIDTIDTNLGVPVHHYVEVDFVGFRGLIDALGGVPMYFDSKVRDTNSGLNIESPGCALLNGDSGLAFARSRNLQWADASGWHTDGSGDLGRMTRQQLLMRAALERTRTLGLDDVGTLKSLIDVGLDATVLDSGLGLGDLTTFGRKFADFDPQHLQTHTLAVTPHRTSGGADVLLLDEEGSASTLAFFRGQGAPTQVTTTTTPPPAAKDVTVSIYNDGAADGEARRVSYVFSGGGFNLAAVDTTTEENSESTVYYAPGGRQMAELVAGWIDPGPELEEDSDLSPGQVVLNLGSDFAHVYEPDDSPTEPADGGSESAGDGTGSSGSGTAPTTTVPEAVGWTPGVAPEGVGC